MSGDVCGYDTGGCSWHQVGGGGAPSVPGGPSVRRGRLSKRWHGKPSPSPWLTCHCKASLWSLPDRPSHAQGLSPPLWPLKNCHRTYGAHGTHTSGPPSPPPPGTLTPRAGPGTEWPRVPRLYTSPCVHTSISFTWRCRRLAHVLMLKIGTQPAFVGERKEGRVHTKEPRARAGAGSGGQGKGQSPESQ